MPARQAVRMIVLYCGVSNASAWAILAQWEKDHGCVVTCMADLDPLFDQWDETH